MGDIRGTDGDDAIAGTVGDDSIVSGFGNDTVAGGNGNDTITDQGGRINTLLGGDGNDLIVFAGRLFANSTHDDLVTSTTIDAGAGDDVVRFDSWYGGAASISLGAGNDLLVLGASQMRGTLFDGTLITLGSGVDRVVLGDGLGRRLDGESFGLFSQDWGARDPLVIADFTAGAGGDSLDLGAFLVGFYSRPNSGTWTPDQNPFASGHVYLVQDGADTLIRIDVLGPPHDDANYNFDFIRLVGVTASALVAHNFAGYDPGGAPLSHSAFSGTAGADRLVANASGSELLGFGGNDDLSGSVGDDAISGGDGDDRLAGAHGADHLLGGLGNDTLDGGAGDDVIEGGDGHDTIVDPGGSDAILGGAGDDRITLTRPNNDPYHLVDTYQSTAIQGGDGNDIVDVTFGRNTDPGDTTLLSIDLGTGNDVFSIDAIRVQTALTLGSGTDRVFVSGLAYDLFTELKLLTISDFAAGAGGDVLDLTDIIQWHSLANPFASGHLRLVQRRRYDRFLGLRRNRRRQRPVSGRQARERLGREPDGVQLQRLRPRRRRRRGEHDQRDRERRHALRRCRQQHPQRPRRQRLHLGRMGRRHDPWRCRRRCPPGRLRRRHYSWRRRQRSYRRQRPRASHLALRRRRRRHDLRRPQVHLRRRDGHHLRGRRQRHG